MRAAATGERLPFLEGLRGLLALYVTLGHAASIADPSALAGRASRAPEWVQAVGRWLGAGHLAVAGFIVVSGFCLQLSLYTSGVDAVRKKGRFFRRRARRILPPYYAALVLSLAVCFLVTQRLPRMPFSLYLPVTPDNTLAHVLLIQNWRPDWMYKINGVMWTIAIEAQLYLLFPALAWTLRRWGRGAALALGAAGAGAITGILPNGPKLYGWYLALFVFGMVAASLAYRPGRRRVPRPGPGLLLALGATGGVALGLDRDWPMPWLDLGFGVVLAALAYAWTVDPFRPGARWLGAKPLFWLGTMSYSLYLVHHPVQQVLFAVRPGGVQDAAGVLIWLLAWTPLVLLFSRGFYRLFERPFYRGATDAGQERPDAFFPIRLPLQAG